MRPELLLDHSRGVHHAAEAGGNSSAIIVAIIAGSVTILVAIVAGAWTYHSAKRDRRRETYSQAVKAAVAWKEMVYRVRRRTAGSEPDLINHYHDMQERLAYYEAWIGAESADMATSYRRMVAKIKSDTEQLITAAWSDQIRPVPGNALPDDAHPDIQKHVDAFVAEVRRHLSIGWWK